MRTLGVLAALSAMSGDKFLFDRFRDKPVKPDGEHLRLKMRANKEHVHMLNGLTEYHFPKGSVWALNKKSALKKATKQNLL